MTTPYRDDREALRGRLASLEAELARLREALQTLDDEQRTAAALEMKIGAVRAELENRTRLEDVRIAAPCSADWNAMVGDDRVRFCDTCQKNVYDLSKMSRIEAERFVASREGPPPCVRLYRRRDGTVITNDCPVGRKRRRVRRIIAASVGGVVLAGAMILRWRAHACTRSFQGSVGSATPDKFAPVDAIAMNAKDAEPKPGLERPFFADERELDLIGVLKWDRENATTERLLNAAAHRGGPVRRGSDAVQLLNEAEPHDDRGGARDPQDRRQRREPAP
jgi:hypothetical protein